MKPGDKFPINLNEWVVAEAVVIDIEDGKVTLDVPATRIVMGVKTSLSDLEPTEPAKETMILTDAPAPSVGPNAQVLATVAEQSEPQSDTVRAADAKTTDAQPVVTNETPTVAPVTVPDDAIGDGLAGVALKEMD